jgi:hypothetical protein
MLKMYDDNQINMKDIGVARTGGGSTANNIASNDRVNLTGSKGLEAGDLSGQQGGFNYYYVALETYKDQVSVPREYNGYPVVALRQRYLAKLCPSGHVEMVYSPIVKYTVQRQKEVNMRVKNGETTFASLGEAESGYIADHTDWGGTYYNRDKAENYLKGKHCGGASQQ